MERNIQQSSSVTLSPKEAEEYCAYKRQKKMNEIMSAMRRAESVLTGSEDVVRTCERAARLKQSALRMTPTDLEHWGDAVRRYPVKIDCVIGGDGETLAKVKAYEVKRVLRMGARELTLRLTPSLVACSRYTLLKKELRRIRRAAGKTILKVRVEKTLPHATLSRLLRIACEGGAQYFSLPYFEGCERLQTELVGGCQLEVSGVNTLPVFQKMAGAGIGRIVTSHAWDIYCAWVKEAEKAVVLDTQTAVQTSLQTSQRLPVSVGEMLGEKRREGAFLQPAAKGEEKGEKSTEEKPLSLPSSRVGNAG